jgi:hypothetical protein
MSRQESAPVKTDGRMLIPVWKYSSFRERQ